MRENAAMDSLDSPDGFLNVAIHVCPYGKMAVPLGGAELPLQKPQAYRSSQSG